MQDKSGETITVGCRVAEADSSYGDGTVQSIQVPVTGGGFNVGVLWDDPEKGGPGWSAEGGGRGGEHLLVIEAAPEPAIGRPPIEYNENDFKTSRFRVRFRRSPTPSELEMDEEDWEDIEDESDGEDGGANGGEDGGGQQQPNAQPEAQPEAEPGSFAAVVRPGARIKISMGVPAKWYGGLVGNEVDGKIVVGFDDGDLQGLPTSELEENFTAKTLLPAVPSEVGVVANKLGCPARAVKLLMYENRGKTKTIGVFLGDEGLTKISGLDVYSEVHVSSDAFEKKAATRGAQSMQDRLGLHSFGQGDAVEYTQAKKDEMPVQAYVYGVIEADPVEADNQFRRLLVLHDRAGIFFLGTLPAWQRVPKPSLEVEFDCDDNEHVQMMSEDALKKMQADFALSLRNGTLSCVGTRTQMKGKAVEPPPQLKQARADAKRAETERNREEAERQKREERERPKRLREEKEEAEARSAREAAAKKRRQRRRPRKGRVGVPNPTCPGTLRDPRTHRMIRPRQRRSISMRDMSLAAVAAVAAVAAEVLPGQQCSASRI